MVQLRYIVFLCFGEEGFFYECVFALLSLSRFYPVGLPAGWEIWVYTDQPEWFGRFEDCPLPVHFSMVGQGDLQQWQGDINYLYRTKIEMLIDFCKGREGALLYLDTDVMVTFQLEQLWQQIEQGHLFMHVPEGKPSSRSSPMLRRLRWHFKGVTLKNGRPFRDLETWNSGVLGFHTRQKELLTDVLGFTDQYYPADHSIRTMEQVAFSAVFGSAAEIQGASPYFLHYWNLKDARLVFSGFFNHFNNRNWEELVHLAAMVQPYSLMLEKVRSRYNRTLGQIISGERWKPDDIDWEMVRKSSGL